MIPGSANALLLATAAGAAGGYEIERSLRFNSADSAYLNRTPASVGNRRTFTWSGWLKRSAFNDQDVFSAQSSTAYFTFRLQSDNTLRVNHWTSGIGDQILYISSQVFRDPSSWYHFVIAVDTTQATSTDRIKVYVNNTQITTWSSSTAPSQNLDTVFNTADTHFIGGTGSGTFAGQYLNGYLADIHLIDGQALDPTSFGEFDANNVWQPIAYTGSYGTNGFHLDFADNSSTAALGYDAAGSNDWTVNNLSVTAGAGNDSLVDSPTNYGTDTGAGGEVRGNYCTLNPLAGTIAPFNGNLSASVLYSTEYVRGTIGIGSGKYYFEVLVETATTGHNIGITTTSSGSLSDYWLYHYNGNIYTTSTTITPGLGVLSQGTVVGVAVDATSGTIAFYRNNTLAHTFTGLSTSATYFPLVAGTSSGTYTTLQCNFGQRPFAYAAPSGFKALCTANLPTPTITKPSTVMDVALYTGNGSTQTISGLNFSPDLVWIKGRSGATDHALYDVVRGTQARLESNTTDAEVTSDSGLTAFNSDGFALSTLAQVNTNSATYAGWCWDAGSSTVTNTAGTITSQVRANASAGFSVVTYTGTGADATIGHGLGVAPKLYIIKRRNSTGNWPVLTTIIDGSVDYAYLNITNAFASTVGTTATLPTSSVFSLGGTDPDVNTNGGTYVAYCFAPVAGYSAFGSYTGNGNADGPFVYTGMRPRWIMVKRSNSTASWHVHDTQRDPTNPNGLTLYPDWSGAELGSDTSNVFDFLSNGFKLRISDAALNANAGTYIYAAFAESPFSLARAR